MRGWIAPTGPRAGFPLRTFADKGHPAGAKFRPASQRCRARRQRPVGFDSARRTATSATAQVGAACLSAWAGGCLPSPTSQPPYRSACSCGFDPGRIPHPWPACRCQVSQPLRPSASARTGHCERVGDATAFST